MKSKDVVQIEPQPPTDQSSVGAAGARLVKFFTSVPARVVGTLLCLFVIAWNVDLARAFAVLARARADYLIAGLLLTIPAVLAAVVEWSVLLECDRPGRWKELTLLYLKSLAPSQVVPTGLGGDAVRIFGSATMVPWQSATAAVAASRIASTIAIFGCSFVASCREFTTYGVWLLVITGGATFGMILFCLFLFSSDQIMVRLVRAIRNLNSVWARHALSFIQAFRETRGEKGRLLACFLAATAGWLMQFWSMQLLANSTGAHVRFDLIPIGFALSMFASAVPFALNGLGIKEGVWIGALVHAGISPAHSAAIALLADLQMVPLACVSALLWIRRSPSG